MPITTVPLPNPGDRGRQMLQAMLGQSQRRARGTYPNTAAVLAPALTAQALVLGRLCLRPSLLLRRRARAAAPCWRLEVALNPLDEAGVVPVLERIACGVD